MKKSSIILVLRTFNSQETKRFGLYLRSPFFNTNTNVVKMYDIIKKKQSDFENNGLTKEFIFKKLYPKEEYNDERMRFLMSELLRHALDFLKYINNNSGFEEIHADINFLRVLNNRNLDKLFIKHLKIVEKFFDKENNFNPFLFRLLIDLESEKINFYISKDRQQESSEAILKKGEYLLFYFLVEILKARKDLLINKIVFNADFEINLVEEFVNNFKFEKILYYLKENSFKFYPIVAIYYYSFMAQLNFKDESYKNLKKLLEENINLFNQGEKYNLYRTLESCCWEKVRSGDKSFGNKLFEIYKYILKEGLNKYEDKSYFRIDYFRNMVINGLNIKEFEWTEKFIIQYVNELAPEHRENMYNFCAALIHFEKGNFEKSLEFITNVSYEYFYLKVDVKNLLLKVYYELNLFEQANSLIDSYKHFLSKNKTLSEVFKTINGAFLNFYIRLIKIKTGDDSVSIKELKTELSKIPHLAHKRWTLEKVDELESGIKQVKYED